MIKHYLTIPEPDWIAGIGLKFTLWDNKDRNASIAAANSLVTKAQAAHDEARNRIQTAVQTAYLKSNEAREAYRLTDSTLSLAKENLRLREKGFSEGLSTADEVNDARTKLLAAEIARRVAAYRFVVAWAMLNAACGDMTPLNNPSRVRQIFSSTEFSAMTESKNISVKTIAVALIGAGLLAFIGIGLWRLPLPLRPR